MSDTIPPPEKDQSSHRRSRGPGRLVVRSAKVPIVAQIAIIVAAFAIALLIVTLALNHLNQPPSTPPAPADAG